MATPAFNLVAMCDAVYVDALTNKHILAGLYSGDVLLNAFPSELRVCFYIDFRLPDTEEHEFDLQIYLDRKRVAGAKGPIRNVGGNETIAFGTPTFSLAIRNPSTLTLKAALDGGTPKRIFTRKVRPRDSTSSPPPS